MTGHISQEEQDYQEQLCGLIINSMRTHLVRHGWLWPQSVTVSEAEGDHFYTFRIQTDLSEYRVLNGLFWTLILDDEVELLSAPFNQILLKCYREGYTRIEQIDPTFPTFTVKIEL